jgi:hypothetical protein
MWSAHLEQGKTADVRQRRARAVGGGARWWRCSGGPVTAGDVSLDAPRRREAPCDARLLWGSMEAANRAGQHRRLSSAQAQAARRERARRGERQQLGRTEARPRLYRARTPRPRSGAHAEGGGAASREGHGLLWPTGFIGLGWAGAGAGRPSGSAQTRRMWFVFISQNYFPLRKQFQ